tara:strand:- start:2 stop:847 length:846 start_codon:yes stop_codon:yes gene_type:complete
MEFKKDFKIKPKEVRQDGTVLFTDGTNDVLPNQLACETYGYKYDTATGSCVSFKPTLQLDQQLKEPSNTIKGVNNKTNKGTSKSIISGTLNTTNGFNENCFISGQGNTINNGINNATVTGVYGKAIRQGEVVLGGGSFNIGAGYTQSSKLQLSFKTTDETPTKLYVQDIVGEYITLQANSIVGFEIYLTRLETGGTSGTAGKFSYRVHKGAVRCDNTGTITIYSYSTTTLASDGVAGSLVIVDSTTSSIPSVTLQVTDRASVNNLWNATVYLHETKTNIAI